MGPAAGQNDFDEMTKLILSAIIMIVGAAFWLWKRYYSKSAEIARLKKRIRQIESEQQNALENNDMLLFDTLDTERLQLCEQVRRLH